ncbi:MAG TPA: DUF4124 domain-containing protein [Ramlibacter sp.]|jgi:hypothetical protein|uniref:DUF4124 domain-containing protein n=1 Tax=Ramlibacter sp. TaxID=1917967 RepID=UPI002D3EF41E|nr:DUF4124 domain-containing protein [Ramlibacter sp.]HZY18613.1 DUF4124 domain-containing protein [Ramlibacter sp.]
MTVLRTLALTLACTLPLTVVAQWQWIDKDGRRVFSDKAPPPEVPAEKILRSAGPRPATAAAEPQAAASAPTAAPKAAGKDKDLEEKRKQALAQEADQKKAKEKELAEARAENCSRARLSKTTMESGVRLSHVNAKGEREVMDDTTRAAELRRLDGIITRDCVQ